MSRLPLLARTRQRLQRLMVLLAWVTVPAWASAASGDGLPGFSVTPEPIEFASAGARLSGALIRPVGTGPGPYPAVVFIHGAGPATFDEPAFRIHANAFVEVGFAVLLYDKRGSGRSKGSLAGTDYADLASDVAAAVGALRELRDIAPERIGLLGRSEGGWVGTLAARADPRIAFLILSSGAGVTPAEQDRYWTRRVMTARGAPEEAASAAVEARAAVWAYYRRVAADPAWSTSAAGLSVRASVEERIRQHARVAPEVVPAIADPRVRPPADFRALANRMAFDPLPLMRQMAVPMLFVAGEREEVVDPAGTAEVVRTLRQLGRDVTLRVLPGVGHALIESTPQGPRYPADYPEEAARWAREKAAMPR